jgi:hypothetical protein
MKILGVKLIYLLPSFLFFAVKEQAQIKQEAISTIKSLIINYADNELPVKAVYFGTQKSELAILYENKNLVINELAQLNDQDLSWNVDNDGSGYLQISSSGSGSILYDYCTTAEYQGKAGDFFSFDNIGLIGFNKTEREYAKFLFNKAFFKDPSLKTKFEKAITALIILYNKSGSENIRANTPNKVALPTKAETTAWIVNNLSGNSAVNGNLLYLYFAGDKTFTEDDGTLISKPDIFDANNTICWLFQSSTDTKVVNIYSYLNLNDVTDYTEDFSRGEISLKTSPAPGKIFNTMSVDGKVIVRDNSTFYTVDFFTIHIDMDKQSYLFDPLKKHLDILIEYNKQGTAR